ncbi:MAG: threonine synthase [Candidatus Marinimicrobia bacterium]|nr:threonine synthase [Candidatus Neomarinimicrobiota bacterium]
MKADTIVGLQCHFCDAMIPVKPFRYTCPDCDNNLDFIYDYERIQNSWSKNGLKQNPDPSIWRYLPLLPVSKAPGNTSLRVGGTPLVNFPKIADKYLLASFQIKDDSRNPSGSLKDRASELGIRHAKEQGKTTLVAASTGNAGSSLAALAAHHGVKSVIFAPASAPIAKLTQIRQHGARLVPVEANYDRAFDLALEWAIKHDHYSRNTGINPVLSEGKKTVALEIAEQSAWQVPEHIFVPVGDGCIISGVYKGFADLLALGWIQKLPRLHAVQAEGSAAIVNSLNHNSEILAVEAKTVADSISVDFPRDGLKARRAIKKSSGSGITVSDTAILEAQKELSRTTGIFAEPAAAAAYAGFLKAARDDLIKAGEKVVVLMTGNGLKDIIAAQSGLGKIESVKADLSEIEDYLKNQ